MKSPTLVRAKREKTKAFNAEEYRYLDQLGFKSPCLMLGIRVAGGEIRGDQPPKQYQFAPGRKWVKLAHPVGGQTAYYHATFLGVKPEKTQDLERLASNQNAREWIEGTKPILNDVDWYHKELESLGLSCDRSFRSYDRHHYPIDLDLIGLLAADRLPISLDDLIQWDSGLERAAGSLDRWSLVLLGD